MKEGLRQFQVAKVLRVKVSVLGGFMDRKSGQRFPVADPTFSVSSCFFFLSLFSLLFFFFYVIHIVFMLSLVVAVLLLFFV